jgi:hypothetical protein
MARLPDIADEALPRDVAELADAQRKHYGEVLNSTRMQGYVPAVAGGAAAMSRGLGRSGKTPKRLSHLLNLRVGSIVGCPL